MIATCFQFGDCIGALVEEYLLISKVYVLIDYIILIFFLWFRADHRQNHIWPRIWSDWNHKLCLLWNTAYHRLDHVCPECGQPGTINLYGPEYDQSGIIL